MKETKPYLLTLVTIFLIISVGLLGTTIYLYFNSSSKTAAGSPDKKVSSVKSINGTRDSLEKVYAATIKDLDASFAAIPAGYSSISGRQDVTTDLSDKKYYDTSTTLENLRNEITNILSDKNPAPDLLSAKAKISELQILVGELKTKNDLISKENERLFTMLKQVTGNSQKNETANKNTNEAVA